MKKATERISAEVLADIRRNVPMGRDTEFSDTEINEKSNRQLLDHWLQWNGIMGYTSSILHTINAIYGTKLERGYLYEDS